MLSNRDRIFKLEEASGYLVAHLISIVVKMLTSLLSIVIELNT